MTLCRTAIRPYIADCSARGHLFRGREPRAWLDLFGNVRDSTTSISCVPEVGLPRLWKASREQIYLGTDGTRLWIGCSDTGSSETTSMRFPTCSVVDRVLARNPETRIFGVTATAARSDGAKDGAHQPPQARSIPQEKRPTESRWPWRNGGGGGNRTRVRKSSALGSTCVASSSI